MVSLILDKNSVKSSFSVKSFIVNWFDEIFVRWHQICRFSILISRKIFHCAYEDSFLRQINNLSEEVTRVDFTENIWAWSRFYYFSTQYTTLSSYNDRGWKDWFHGIFSKRYTAKIQIFYTVTEFCVLCRLSWSWISFLTL